MQQLNLFQLAVGHRHSFAQVLRRLWCDPRNASRDCLPLEQLPDLLFAERGFLYLAAAFTGRNTCPSVMPAWPVQAWIATLAHVGIGTILRRFAPDSFAESDRDLPASEK